MVKRFQWLILLLLTTTFTVSAQSPTPAVAEPSIQMVAVTLLVKDYDEAAKWYSEKLGFQVRDNKDLRPGKRWAAMFSKEDPKFQIILHKPGNGYMDVDKELTPDRIGKETFWILRTNGFDALVKRLKDGGVRFRSPAYDTGGGRKSIVIEDLYGNLWVLQQPGTRN